MNCIIDLPTVFESERIAARLADGLISPLTLALSGEIGSGKTTLIRAMLRALGVKAAIKSPTFTLVESYQMSLFQIHHFDLYRIQDEAELEYIGFRDYFSKDAVCCIEWPEHVPGLLEQVDIHFELTLQNAGRKMRVSAYSPEGLNLLEHVWGSSPPNL